MALGIRVPPFAWEGICLGFKLVITGERMPALSCWAHRSLAVFSSRPTNYRANFCGLSRQINLFSAPSPGTVGSLGFGFD